MYEVYNQNQSESTQMLLGTDEHEHVREEKEELLDDKMAVRYFGSNEKLDSKKYSVA
jgi:hypothetical protein